MSNIRYSFLFCNMEVLNMENKIVGDICKLQNGIICHQVNCQRKMGKGLALQIRKNFIQHYLEYINTEPELGKILTTEISSELYVVALYSQYYFGSTGKVFTDYKAFKECLKLLKDFSHTKKLTIYIPYKIGCGLGGGDWNIIYSFIKEILDEYTIVFPHPYLV